LAEKIKITSIKLENYRQFFGTQSVTFPSREDGFATIIGENGAGKSNLLNAINWCLYKKEPHTKKNKGYYIINEKYLDSIDNGNIANMSVQVEIQKGDDEYRISRILKVIKNQYQYEILDSDTKTLKITEAQGYPLPAGCEVIEGQSTFEIFKRQKHEQDFHSDKKTPPKIIMNEILPESLSSYFILDGEFLEKFWTGIQKVQKGIEQISQLHLLNTTLEHLSDLKKSVPDIGDKDIDNLTLKIRENDYYELSKDSHGNEKWSSALRWNYDPETDENEYYHATGKPRIKELNEDIKKMEHDIGEITEKFGASNIDAVKLLNDQQKKAASDYKESVKLLKQMEKIYFSSLIENAPQFFLKPAIKYSIKLVDDLRAKGDLPYEAKKIFTNDLLERGTCICQTDLESKMIDNKETNSSRLEVITVRDKMANDQGLDGSISMKFHFEEKLLGDYDKFTRESFDKPRTNYSKIRVDTKKLENGLKELNIQLQNIGHADIEELAKNQQHLLQKIQEATKTISEIEYKIKDNVKKTLEYKSDRKRLLGKNAKSKRIAHEQKIWDTITEIFEKTYYELKQEIRDEVQLKTLEIFLKTMYKEDIFKKFIIKDDFEVELIDQKDVSILGSLSAGESLFLALSFISAIRYVTGYKFPLVIDTPLGRVSGTPRYLLSQALPKYLPNEQIIFLATDTEFLNPDTNVHEVEGRPELPFGQLLEEHIKVRYSLITGMEKNVAKIIDFVPKWRRR